MKRKQGCGHTHLFRTASFPSESKSAQCWGSTTSKSPSPLGRSEGGGMQCGKLEVPEVGTSGHGPEAPEGAPGSCTAPAGSAAMASSASPQMTPGREGWQVPSGAAGSGAAPATEGPAGGGAGRGRGADTASERPATACPPGKTTPGMLAAGGEAASAVPGGPGSGVGSAEDEDRLASPAARRSATGLRVLLRAWDVAPPSSRESCPSPAGSCVVRRSA